MEGVLHEILFAACSFEALFESVEGDVEELGSILLDAYIYRLAAVFVGKAEIAGVIRDTVGQSQVREKPLELVEEVVIDEAVIVLDHLWCYLIMGCHHAVSEDGHVVELLDH